MDDITKESIEQLYATNPELAVEVAKIFGYSTGLDVDDDQALRVNQTEFERKNDLVQQLTTQLLKSIAGHKNDFESNPMDTTLITSLDKVIKKLEESIAILDY